MTIEIHNPDLVQRLTMHIRTGQFHDADELIEKALDALDQHTVATSPATETGAVALAALQDSPYPDIDLTPPKEPAAPSVVRAKNLVELFEPIRGLFAEGELDFSRNPSMGRPVDLS